MKRQSDNAIKMRIRAAALHLFSTRGMENTFVRDIVRYAHTTQPMLYYYFDSKETLYLDIFEERSKELLSRISTIVFGNANLRNKLTELFTLYADYFSGSPAIAGFLLRSSSAVHKSKRLMKAVGASRELHQELIVRMFKERSTYGELPISRILTATELTHSVMLYFLFSRNKTLYTDAAGTLPATMAETICSGLKGGDSPTP